MFFDLKAFLLTILTTTAGMFGAVGQCLSSGVPAAKVAIVATAGMGVAGCHGSGNKGAVTTADAEQFLKKGKFKGNGKWSQSGAPFSLGQKTVVWAGPEAATFEFQGEFDFSGTEPVQ